MRCEQACAEYGAVSACREDCGEDSAAGDAACGESDDNTKSGSTSSCGNSGSSSRKTARSWVRARCAPMQKCGP